MTVFDRAQYMTLAATERDEFRVIDVTQLEMDMLSGSEGFLSYTSPFTKEMFIVEGLPEPLRDVTLEYYRGQMRSGVEGPGLHGNSIFDFIKELSRIERGPQLDTRRRLPPVPSLQMPSVFRTPPLPERLLHLLPSIQMFLTTLEGLLAVCRNVIKAQNQCQGLTATVRHEKGWVC